MLRHLVDGACRKDIARSQGFEHGPDVESTGQVVNVGIAQIGGDGIAAVFFHDGEQALLDFGEGLVPLHLYVVPVAFDQRPLQTVRVLMDSGNRGSLGADVSAAEYVAGVSAYFDDFVRFNLKLEPTGCLAERAGSENCAVGLLGHDHPPVSWAPL